MLQLPTLWVGLVLDQDGCSITFCTFYTIHIDVSKYVFFNQVLVINLHVYEVNMEVNFC